MASDPHAPPGGQVSRDHVISTNPRTGTTFVAGGKWTTWREMAQDVLDRVPGDGTTTCNCAQRHAGDANKSGGRGAGHG